VIGVKDPRESKNDQPLKNFCTPLEWNIAVNGVQFAARWFTPYKHRVVLEASCIDGSRFAGLSVTVELLEAHRSVIARRSNKGLRRFSVEDWKELHKAIKKVFG